MSGKLFDDRDVETEEEKRVMRAVKNSDNRVKGATNAQRSKNDAWVVKITNLPQGPGQLVICKVNGQEVYISSGTEDPVSVDLNIPIQPAPSNIFTLQVQAFPWPQFEFNATEGTYLKFSLDGSKFERAQQSKPFF